MRTVLKIFFGVVAFVIVAIAIALIAVNESKPTGTSGPEADALARSMVAWTQPDAWARTGAVQWSFGGRNDHLWDRARGLAQVRWGGNDVRFRTSNRDALVYVDGVETKGEAAQRLVESAYAKWINDAFWLNPFEGVFDASTERAIVTSESGGPQLLVTYGSGGVTPGDSYLWAIGSSGQPTAWKMWVSIIPIGGMEVTWDEWITLSTGAKISTLHRGPVELRISNVKGAATLDALLDGQPDPFASLIGGGTESERAPASRPSKPASPAPAALPPSPREVR